MYVATVREQRRRGQHVGDFVASTLFDTLPQAQKWASLKINQEKTPEARPGEDEAWAEYDANLKKSYASLRPNTNGFRSDQ